MDFILTILGVLLTALLALLGIEKSKAKKQARIISKQEQQLTNKTQQNEVYESSHDVVEQIIEDQKETEENQEKEEEVIEDAKTDEEVIQASNDIIDNWNADRLPNRNDSE